MKKNFKKIAALMAAMTYGLCTVSVQASPSVDQLILFKGTRNLITAGTGALTALIGAAAIFFTLKSAGIWLAAEEEEKDIKKRAFINTIIVSVIATVVPGVVTWVLAFYK